MQVEIGDGWPPFFYRCDLALQLVRHAPAHRIGKSNSRDLYARVGPHPIHAIEHHHALIEFEFANPVGSKSRTDMDAAVRDAVSQGAFNLLWPFGNFLRLCPMIVALRKDVAHRDTELIF